MTANTNSPTIRRYWESFYGDLPTAPATAAPNTLLADELTALPRGAALDLACGRGGDAIWLASRGWTVTATDVSDAALATGARRAAGAGVGQAITWSRHDLSESFPSGSFDLVTASYLHSPVPVDRAAILRRAAEVVGPGGHLLILSHAGRASWQQPGEPRFSAPAEIVDELALRDRGWTIERAELVRRELTGPDGKPGSRLDSVVHAVRPAGG